MDRRDTLHIRNFDSDLKRRLRVAAAELDRTVSGVVDEACRLWLDGIVKYEDLRGSGAAPTRDDGFARTAESGRSLKSAGVVSGGRRGDSRPSTSGHVGVAQSGVQSTVTASSQSGPQSKKAGQQKRGNAREAEERDVVNREPAIDEIGPAELLDSSHEFDKSRRATGASAFKREPHCPHRASGMCAECREMQG